MESIYKPQDFESKWQREWEETGIYVTREGSDKPKFYCLEFFPYPSGDGLHVGHCKNYLPLDALTRFLRMRGYNVLHPMGWDAFGEPTEQAAIKHGIHPRESTDRNTANFKRQLRLIGTSYDWRREIDSSDPAYYRWTQWFFLMLYRRGLAYYDTNWQWWCNTCQTTLSSHEVEGGVCWRGHADVTKKEVPAWYFKITAYADELVDSLDEIDWPDSVKAMQANWIGRSEGAEIDFRTEGGEVVPVFTTRPDTIWGATFFVMAPEHPLVEGLTTDSQQAEVEAYVKQAIARSDIERAYDDREKTGVFTGGCVVNPVNEEKVPVWIADYVLPSYGTGAVMAVPAHDQRDFEFAHKYGLPVRVVIAPPEWDGEALDAAYVEAGEMVNSGQFDGTPSRAGVEKVTAYMAAEGIGRAKVNYRMHDWLISRQRYWGAPIPMAHCAECGIVPVPEEDLPVLLPEMEDFTPDNSGRSPLARVPEFVNTTCPACGGPAERETDTMGGFACSSWYYLRFTSPHYDEGPFEPEALRYWAPPDLYVGGTEHAVLHLLYSRFWVKVMADAGLVPFREPFPRLMNQGILHGPDGSRMSKSRGNTIVPDDIAAQYSADALRVYLMFATPFDQEMTWNEEGIKGAWRFLNKVWRLYASCWEGSREASEEDIEVRRAVHRLVKETTGRIEEMRFNTMVSSFMEFVNLLGERQRAEKWQTADFHQALETFMLILAPAVPHIAEELWRETGHSGSVHQQDWPDWDEALAAREVVQVAVQVNGKTREVIEVDAGMDEAEVRALALVEPNVKKFIDGKEVVRVVYVPGKVLNIVVK